MAIRVIDIPGIGPKTAEYLTAEGIDTAESLIQAGIGELLKAPGFHLNRANTVLDAARALLSTADAEAVATDKPAKKAVKKAPKKKEAKKVKAGKFKDKKSKKDKEDKKDKKGKGKAKGKDKDKDKDKKKGKKKKKS